MVYDLIIYVQSTIFSYVETGHPRLNLYFNNFQLYRDGSSSVEPVLTIVCSVICDFDIAMVYSVICDCDISIVYSVICLI